MTLRSPQAYEQYETKNRQPYVVIHAGHVGFFYSRTGKQSSCKNYFMSP
jgi:hypothetical protein